MEQEQQGMGKPSGGEFVFFHTAQALPPLFDQLMARYAPQYRVRHVMRDDLLKRAVSAGKADFSIIDEAADAIIDQCSENPVAIICTCSTIGESVDLAATKTSIPIFRIDHPMAAEAVKQGTRIHVMAALATTIDPTMRLIAHEAEHQGRQINLTSEVVPNASALLMAGKKEEYLQSVAAAMEVAATDFDVVVLAQASMSEAAKRVRNASTLILSSPEIGVRGILERIANS